MINYYYATNASFLAIIHDSKWRICPTDRQAMAPASTNAPNLIHLGSANSGVDRKGADW